jgi:hypothetical protein
MPKTKKPKPSVHEVKALPLGCWLSPLGKILSKKDQFLIQLPAEDLAVLPRAIDVTLAHLDEARRTEDRLPFAERLIRLREQEHEGPLHVEREDLHALHRVLDTAAVNDYELRGEESPRAFLKRLIQIRKTILKAVYEHDDVPSQERSDG